MKKLLETQGVRKYANLQEIADDIYGFMEILKELANDTNMDPHDYFINKFGNDYIIKSGTSIFLGFLFDLYVINDLSIALQLFFDDSESANGFLLVSSVIPEYKTGSIVINLAHIKTRGKIKMVLSHEIRHLEDCVNEWEHLDRSVVLVLYSNITKVPSNVLYNYSHNIISLLTYYLNKSELHAFKLTYSEHIQNIYDNTLTIFRHGAESVDKEDINNSFYGMIKYIHNYNDGAFANKEIHSMYDIIRMKGKTGLPIICEYALNTYDSLKGYIKLFDVMKSYDEFNKFFLDKFLLCFIFGEADCKKILLPIFDLLILYTDQKKLIKIKKNICNYINKCIIEDNDTNINENIIHRIKQDDILKLLYDNMVKELNKFKRDISTLTYNAIESKDDITDLNRCIIMLGKY